MAKKFIILIASLFILLFAVNAASAVELCQSGDIKTSASKDYQMLYPDETFVRVVDKDSLKDLAQLKALACLQYLDATDWGVKGDIANLKGLPNLEVLSLHSNTEVYGDICSLKGATKLRSLKFAFDEKVYGDISCLRDLNLETFAMTYTKISGDISGLSRMTNLKALYLTGTDISGDISALSQLTNLEELGISDESAGKSKITGDLASLDNLKKLRKVSLHNMNAKNCRHFTEAHPNIEQGGCSKESQATLVDKNKASERKIGKEYTATTGSYTEQTSGSFFDRLRSWLKNLFS